MSLFKKSKKPSTNTKKKSTPKNSKNTKKSDKSQKSSSTASSAPKKVYRNAEGKIVYKQSTDKVGDILVNPAGVKYKIISERFHAPTGYDDGQLKVRVLKLKPMTKNGTSFEMGDGSVAHARKNGIFKRLRESK